MAVKRQVEEASRRRDWALTHAVEFLRTGSIFTLTSSWRAGCTLRIFSLEVACSLSFDRDLCEYTFDIAHYPHEEVFSVEEVMAMALKSVDKEGEAIVHGMCHGLMENYNPISREYFESLAVLMALDPLESVLVSAHLSAVVGEWLEGAIAVLEESKVKRSKKDEITLGLQPLASVFDQTPAIPIDACWAAATASLRD